MCGSSEETSTHPHMAHTGRMVNPWPLSSQFRQLNRMFSGVNTSSSSTFAAGLKATIQRTSAAAAVAAVAAVAAAAAAAVAAVAAAAAAAAVAVAVAAVAAGNDRER